MTSLSSYQQSHTDSSTWVRDPEHSLAQLTLHQFQASATIESHGAIDACVSMENCVLDNKRVEKKARRISRWVIPPPPPPPPTHTDIKYVCIGDHRLELGSWMPW